jgi:hypothetical protein
VGSYTQALYAVLDSLYPVLSYSKALEVVQRFYRYMQTEPEAIRLLNANWYEAVEKTIPRHYVEYLFTQGVFAEADKSRLVF